MPFSGTIGVDADALPIVQFLCGGRGGHRNTARSYGHVHIGCWMTLMDLGRWTLRDVGRWRICQDLAPGGLVRCGLPDIGHMVH